MRGSMTSYVRRDAESQPFVKEFILPRCALVGPRHRIVRFESPRIEVSDATDYADRDLTDEEFAAELDKAART